jgi:hypothetical protein
MTPAVDNTNDAKIDGTKTDVGSKLYVTFALERGMVDRIYLVELFESYNVVTSGFYLHVNVEESEDPSGGGGNPLEPAPIPGSGGTNPGLPPDPNDIVIIPPFDPVSDPSLTVKAVCISSPPDCLEGSGGGDPEIQVAVSWTQIDEEGVTKVKIRRILYPYANEGQITDGSGIVAGSSEILGSGTSSAVATTEHLVNGIFAERPSSEILLRSAPHGISTDFDGNTVVSHRNPNRNPEIDSSGGALHTVWHWQEPYLSSNIALETASIMDGCVFPKIYGRRSLDEGSTFDSAKEIFKIHGSCYSWPFMNDGNDGGSGTIIIVISSEELIPVIDGLDPFIPDLPDPPIIDGSMPDYPFDPEMTLAFLSPADDPELAGLDLYMSDLVLDS